MEQLAPGFTIRLASQKCIRVRKITFYPINLSRKMLKIRLTRDVIRDCMTVSA